MAAPRQAPRHAGLHASWRAARSHEARPPRVRAVHAGPSVPRHLSLGTERVHHFVPRPPAWLLAPSAAPQRATSSLAQDEPCRWALPASEARAMQHAWHDVSDDVPAEMHAASLAPHDDASSRVLAMLQNVLAGAVERDAAHNEIQAALALAYTTLLKHVHDADTLDDAPMALTLLGLAAEALVGLDTEPACILARKLLTYAQLHIGAVDACHFRRIAQRLGERGHMERVLQFEHLAHTHHPQVLDEKLHLARLLAYDALGRDADYAAARTAHTLHTYAARELDAWHAARRHDTDALVHALHALQGRIRPSTYLVLAYAHAPLRPVLAHLAPDALQAPAPALFTALLRAAHQAKADAHIPYLLALFGLDSPVAEAALPRAVHEALAATCRIDAPAPALAMAASWCGRHGDLDTALDLFRQTHAAAPRSAPRTPVEERRTPRERSGDHAALQYAAAGVMLACVRSDRPAWACAFAAHVLGVPPLEGGAADAAWDARLATLPAASVERGSACTAALLECAGALERADYARAVLVDAAAHGLKPNGRVRRALARLMIASVDGHAGEVQHMYGRLAEQVAWVGGPPPHAQDASPAEVRLAKLRDALSALGFEDHVQLALLSGARQQCAAGAARSAPPEPRDASYVWVRDTPLQPAPDEPWSAVPTPPAPAVERTPHAHAARLRLCAAQGDADGAHAAFRALLDADVRPGAMHIVPLMQSLCRARRTSEAQWLLRVALPSWDVAPTHAMHATLIHAFAHAGDWRAVQREVQEMHRAGLVPDAHLYDTIAAARERLLDERPAVEPMRGVVTHPGAVAQHFARMMHARDYLGAQQFYAQCLDDGLAPTYALRRMLKRARNYIEKQLREGANAGALHEALQLQQANARASAFATHPAGKRRIEARRAYRHALLDLLRDVVSGAMEQAARMYTPSTAEDGYEK